MTEINLLKLTDWMLSGRHMYGTDWMTVVDR